LIAKHAQEHKLSVKQSAAQLGLMTEAEFDAILGDVDRITGRG
jgi:aspartate ammonia-lyase